MPESRLRVPCSLVQWFSNFLSSWSPFLSLLQPRNPDPSADDWHGDQHPSLAVTARCLPAHFAVVPNLNPRWPVVDTVWTPLAECVSGSCKVLSDVGLSPAVEVGLGNLCISCYQENIIPLGKQQKGKMPLPPSFFLPKLCSEVSLHLWLVFDQLRTAFFVAGFIYQKKLPNPSDK